MGRVDTAPHILNLDINYKVAVSFTHQSFVTGDSKQKQGKRGGKRVNSYKDEDGRLVRLTTLFK
jgi:hypothetical protein